MFAPILVYSSEYLYEFIIFNSKTPQILTI